MAGGGQYFELDRDSDVSTELPQQGFVLRRKRTGGLVQEIERADDLSLSPHRDRQLRQHVPQRSKVARLEPDVVHQDRAPLLNRGAHDTLAHVQAQGRAHPFGIAHRVRNAKLLTRLIE